MRSAKSRKKALVVLAMVSLSLLIISSLPLYNKIDSLYPKKIAAAKIMQKAMEELVSFHGLQVDVSLDRNRTGMIGPEITPFTTTLGPIEVKRTTTNTDFAALAVQLLWDVGVRTGDVIAIGVSGSFPALTLAVRSAAEVLELKVISIVSLGSSTYGATDPAWTWLDMEQFLFDIGIFGQRSIAASEGGDRDTLYSPLFPEASMLAELAIERNGVTKIDAENFSDSVNTRMNLYLDNAGERKLAAFVNIGGADVNLGPGDIGFTLPAGIVRTVPTISSDSQGVISKMDKIGVPIINFLNIKDLCLQYDIAFDALYALEPGNTPIYFTHTYNGIYLVLGAVFLSSILLFILWDRKNSNTKRGKTHTIHTVIVLSFFFFCFPNQSIQASLKQFFHPDFIEFEKIQTPGVSNTIVEDALGFLWVGTDVGLWRYDGYAFKNYSHVVPERIDVGMFQDSRGILWIGTESGLIAFNPITNERTTYRHDEENEKTISNHVFQYKKHVFCEDTQKNLWIATDKGLNHFNYDTLEFEAFTAENAGLIDNYVTAVIRSHNGLLWVATFDGLQLFDPLLKKIVRYIPGAPKNMYSLCEDSLGNLWIGTYLDGLYRLDSSFKQFESISKSKDISHDLGSDMITFLLIPRLSPGVLWIATFDGGLSLLEINTGNVHRFVDGGGCSERPGLSGNTLAHMIEDRMGAVYILNEHGFLNRVDPEAKRFTTYSSSTISKSSVPIASAYSVWSDKYGSLWMVDGSGTLGLYDDNNTVFQPTVVLPNHLDTIAAVDISGSVWFKGDGVIAQFNPRTRTITDTIMVKGLRISGINDHLHPEILWFGSADSGLIKINKESHEISYIHPSKDDPFHDTTPSVMRLILAQDSEGYIWISTFGVGLQKFDPKTELLIDTYVPEGKNTGNPSALFIDSNGRYWVSFQNAGPSLFNPASGTFTSFEEISGNLWPARGSTGILEDGDGNLWISGNGSGELVRFNPDTTQVRFYTQEDGIAPGTSDTLNWHPIVAEDGSFWFSGMGGVTQFFPEFIRDNFYEPPVYITNVLQDGKPILHGLAHDDNYCVILPAEKNYFEFEAVALNYRLSQSNLYQFRLYGRDENWVHVGAQRTGYYSGLTEGLYILEVIGTNNDGIQSSISAKLKVCVLPKIPEDTEVVDYLAILSQERIVVGHETNYVMFEIVPINYNIQRKNPIEYMLEGYDSQWIAIESQRYATYKKLAAGSYTMKVRDTDSEIMLNVPIRILPIFYKSWWFVGTLINIIILIIIGFLVQKTNHLRKEKSEFERNREREILLNQEKHEAFMKRYEAISDKEKALDALQRSERRYRDLLSTMSEGFIVLNAQMQIVYANKRFCSLTGYSIEDLKDFSIENMILRDENYDQEKILHWVKTDNASFELVLTTSEHAIVTVLVSTKTIFDEKGDFKEGYVVITDISRLKDTEEKLRAREREILEEKGDLEEMNTTLKVLLDKRNEDIDIVKTQLCQNLRELVIPYVGQLEHTSLDQTQKMLVSMIAKNLEEINTSYVQTLGIEHSSLTQTEIRIAMCIKEGYETKKIADMFNISERTVEFHRAGIRKKLGLKGKNKNLQSYLRDCST